MITAASNEHILNLALVICLPVIALGLLVVVYIGSLWTRPQDDGDDDAEAW